MRDLGALLLVGLALAACSGKHDGPSGAGGRGGRAGRGGAGADSQPDSGPEELDASEGADAESGGRAGHVAGGGMSGGCERRVGGDSGSGGVPIVDRGTTGGAGGVRYPCSGDGMLHSTPGRTDCGPTDCMSYPTQPTNSLGQPYCCVRGEYFCASGNLAVCESGVPYYCDEAADCQDGLHCCSNTVRMMFTCQASCEGRIQLCKTDAECENGEACEPYDCGNQLRGICGSTPPRWSMCKPL